VPFGLNSFTPDGDGNFEAAATASPGKAFKFLYPSRGWKLWGAGTSQYLGIRTLRSHLPIALNSNAADGRKPLAGSYTLQLPERSPNSFYLRAILDFRLFFQNLKLIDFLFTVVNPGISVSYISQIFIPFLSLESISERPYCYVWPSWLRPFDHSARSS
jgi:hypothetical protein